MKMIVDALRRREEPLLALDDDPPATDTAIDQVAEQLRQQLRDTTAARRRVDVPHCAAFQAARRRSNDRRKTLEICGQSVAIQARCLANRDIDLPHACPPRVLVPHDARPEAGRDPTAEPAASLRRVKVPTSTGRPALSRGRRGVHAASRKFLENHHEMA